MSVSFTSSTSTGSSTTLALTKCLQRARQERIPVAVTEHTVRGEARPWERETQLLTSLTESGAEMLRARWPGKRVEYLPHGCPTWFPRRKQTRGRVIGAFGFLEPHKGFWKLLDVLRAMPGAELLLVSHSKNRNNDERWSNDAAALAVRHYREFMPVAEAARRLAAEADILVYWYDDAAHVSASGAVRVGLATGVPVLASPTNWFNDLRGVTYQPADLFEGVRRLFDDTALRDGLTAARARLLPRAQLGQRIAERHRDALAIPGCTEQIGRTACQLNIRIPASTSRRSRAACTRSPVSAPPTRLSSTSFRAVRLGRRSASPALPTSSGCSAA